MALGNPIQVAAAGLIETMRRAFQAHAAGRLGEAESCCRFVLAANKKQFDAMHLLGVIELQRGRLDEARRLLRQALKVYPRSVPALSNLGVVLQQSGRLEDALASVNKALAIEPNYLLALNIRGHLTWRLKRPEEALKSLDRALSLKPDYVDALCNRGNALVDLKRFDEALTSYDRALAITPNDALALNNRGTTLWALNRADEALRSYDRALALDPNDLATLKDRGAALSHLRRSEEALECFDRALALKPGDSSFLVRRGSVLTELNRYEEALNCFDQAFETASGDAEALCVRSNALAGLQRNAEALAGYDQALALAPELPQIHWNRGITLLRMGNFEQGWKDYEWRYQVEIPGPGHRQFSQPRWHGEGLIAGKVVLLYAEQGFGDTIQFARYAALVAGLGAKVVLEVQPALKELCKGIEGAQIVIGHGEELPPFDLQCPLLSLPLAFNTRMASIPSNTPYLSALPTRMIAWEGRLPKSEIPRVGICWAGNPGFLGDRPRSIGLQRLAPLLTVPGVQFVSLQKDLRAGDEDLLRRHPHVIHLGDQLNDFSDTAAIMSSLDLVISSDTVPVHLAGALGRRVWILLQYSPDWRWLLDRSDNPWYPSARLFRQSRADDWEGVVCRLAEELNSWRPGAVGNNAGRP